VLAVVLLGQLLIYIDNATANLPIGNIIADPVLEIKENYVHSELKHSLWYQHVDPLPGCCREHASQYTTLLCAFFEETL
jgi:hypothetical protein